MLLPFALGLLSLVGCQDPSDNPGQNDAFDSLKIELQDTLGQTHRPLDVPEGQARVLIFVTHDCPIANYFAPEIQRIREDYRRDDLSFQLVHIDPTITTDRAREHGAERKFDFPILIDSDHQLVRALGIEISPEVALISAGSAEPTIHYRGRIDDRYADFGKRKVEASRRDLREALDRYLKGERAELVTTQAIGCPVPSLSR